RGGAAVAPGLGGGGWGAGMGRGGGVVAWGRRSVERVFHDVADGDDTGQTAVLHDREMPDPIARHPRHHRRDAVRRRARLDGHRHDVRDGQPDDIWTVLAQRANDVALRNDAEYPLAVLTHEKGADALRPEVPGGYPKRRVGPNGLDVRALGF